MRKITSEPVKCSFGLSYMTSQLYAKLRPMTIIAREETDSAQLFFASASNFIQPCAISVAICSAS
jgi:hypothetical protein